MRVSCYPLCICLISTFSYAEVYRCDVNGKQVYQDIPCREEAAQTVVEIEKHNQKIEYDNYDESHFTEWENALIKQKKVSVGMSEEALIQSWGFPIDINRSAYGPEQWVFRYGRYDRRYAYLVDGKVVNWSE
ncbi:DUF4124 domain-containing protein [Shewanella algae]|uniref:DUF4124 domain-containing protein n=1 Tax=Shewanella algae TaxID=38313 RepID=UPI00300550D5